MSDPVNYAKLDAQLSGLEERQTAAYVLLGAGLAAPIATWAVYSAVRSDEQCPPQPTAGTPNFEAASQAWFDCNADKHVINPVPIVVGIGLLAAGVVGAMIVAPKESDLIEFVNLHNRLTVQPLRWEFGYDPTNRSGYAGAALSF